MPSKPTSPRRPGRPAKRWLSCDQVAAMLDAEPSHVAQACAPPVSFFPGAVKRCGEWMIPAKMADAVATNAGTLPVPLLRLATFAKLVDLSYQAALKQSKRGSIRTVQCFEGLRVPVSEYWRAIRGATPRPFSFFKEGCK